MKVILAGMDGTLWTRTINAPCFNSVYQYPGIVFDIVTKRIHFLFLPSNWNSKPSKVLSIISEKSKVLRFQQHWLKSLATERKTYYDGLSQLNLPYSYKDPSCIEVRMSKEVLEWPRAFSYWPSFLYGREEQNELTAPHQRISKPSYIYAPRTSKYFQATKALAEQDICQKSKT